MMQSTERIEHGRAQAQERRCTAKGGKNFVTLGMRRRKVEGKGNLCSRMQSRNPTRVTKVATAWIALLQRNCKSCAILLFDLKSQSLNMFRNMFLNCHSQSNNAILRIGRVLFLSTLKNTRGCSQGHNNISRLT